MMKLRPLALCVSLAFAMVTSACAVQPHPPERSRAGTEPPIAPEGPSGYLAKKAQTAKHFMIAAANPLATNAGYDILRSGGSAVDAAIAAQMVLMLVEPQSSGIGGGGFLLHFDGKEVQAFDGRETAPAAVDGNLFRRADGSTMPFREAVVGGRSVGTPGTLRMLELAHQRHGKLPWASLFAPAIRLSEQGFAVSPRLATLLQREQYLKKDPVAAAYFYDAAGEPWPVGHLLKNPALAETLRVVAAGGADAFYTGRIAADIADKVQRHADNPGRLTVKDIADYRPVMRQPVCTDYKAWTVCGMPPPSSGGIAVAQMLGILENKNIRAFPPHDGVPDPEAVHLFSEAGRLAYADRARYVADTDFVALPANSIAPLLNRQYLAERAALIREKSMLVAPSGVPPATDVARGLDRSPELPSTSHVSVVDADGNAVAMTNSIENGFGARLMVDGFLLNNQLTDFSFVPADTTGPVANRVQPGKRPRSAMAPTFVFKRGSGELVLATGSPGGASIINYVTKVLIGVLDWKLDMQQAIDLPNFGSRNGPTELEQGRVPDALVEALRAKGHNIRLMDHTSGVQGIMRIRGEDGPLWQGGADPRREGTARGE